ncbi:Hypothetical protein FKW44_011503, partial [Caligus rogercresseyi]
SFRQYWRTSKVLYNESYQSVYGKIRLILALFMPWRTPKPIKYWNNALICWFKLYASIHSHWECLETAR